MDFQMALFKGFTRTYSEGWRNYEMNRPAVVRNGGISFV